VKLFRQTVEDMLDCLCDAEADIELVDLVQTYLLAQGKSLMADCIQNEGSPYYFLAQVQDRLGWDCFVEGRISTLFLETMKPCLARAGRRSLEKWGCALLNRS